MARDFDGNEHKRDPQKGWSRDEKGRPFRLDAGSRAYRDQRDRDEALEEVYTGRPCARDCCKSLFAGVLAHQPQLIAEYMAWCLDRHAQQAYNDETLAQWERERFGARLYPAPHGVLLFGVKCAVFGDPYKRLKPSEGQAPKTLPGFSDAERLERMQVALAANADAKTMPDRMSGEEWDQRQQELRSQQRELEAGGK
jgi:hypothetical protein